MKAHIIHQDDGSLCLHFEDGEWESREVWTPAELRATTDIDPWDGSDPDLERWVLDRWQARTEADMGWRAYKGLLEEPLPPESTIDIADPV